MKMSYKCYSNQSLLLKIQNMRVQNLMQQQISLSFRIKSQSMKNPSQIVGHYRIGDMIGRGGFAKVYKAIELYTKSQIAVKIVKLDELSAKDIEHLRRQIQIHRQLQHPNIIRIYQVLWIENKVFLFMELAKGKELFSTIVKHGPLSEHNAAKVFYQVIGVVKYLHDHGIAHRDIKTQNIIIDQDYNPKLIDFGLAKSFEVSDSALLQTFCGSPSYTAPELLQKRKYNGQRVDIWCLGVTLYVLLQASLPFDEFDKKLRQRNIHFLNWHKPLYSSQQAIQIYQAIFTKEKKRISIENLLELEFFRKHNLPSKLQYKSVNDQLNTTVVKKVCKLLSVHEKEVENAVNSKTLGEIFSVYQLCLLKKQEVWEQLKKTTAKSEHKKRIYSKLRNSTLEPASEKNRVESRPESPSKQSLIRILPTIEKDIPYKRRRDSKNLPKMHNDISVERYKTDIFDKFQLSSESKTIANLKFKNIFTSNIDVPIPKPRSRDDIRL